MTAAPRSPTAPAFPVSARRLKSGRYSDDQPGGDGSNPGFGSIRRPTRPRSPGPRNSGNTLAIKRLANRRHVGPTGRIPVYTYRYLDPLTGRWTSRDPIEEKAFVLLEPEQNRQNFRRRVIRAEIGSNPTLVFRKELDHKGIGTVIASTTKHPQELAGGYIFVENAASSNVDVLGLKLYACLTPTAGGQGTHAFIYSSELGEEDGMWGQHGCLGLQLSGNGGGKLMDGLKNCKVIKLPRGMSETEAFNKVKDWPYWHKDFWCPFINDCHNKLEQAVKDAGLEWPGLPGGRVPQPGEPCCPISPNSPNPLDPPGGPFPTKPYRPWR